MISSVEIAFLFISLKRLRLDRVANITGLGTIDLWHEKQFLKRAERDFRVARRPC